MLKPLGDRLLIKRFEAEEKTASGLVLPSKAKEAPNMAEIIAISEELEKDEKKGSTIKVGDKVIYSKFSGTEVKYEGTDYLIIKYTDLLAVL
ncbi:chaperonin GroS [Peptostreptococcaceae bacterium oral taxon 113 str. W5053]|nr:chaperonin GroS [Peptostreptococcaceae bacterium oral taxon 113 str. W5053]